MLSVYISFLQTIVLIYALKFIRSNDHHKQYLVHTAQIFLAFLSSVFIPILALLGIPII